MRLMFPLVLTAIAVTGCTAKEEATAITTEGRYQGVGVYDAGAGWARIAVPPAQEVSAKATRADDDHVIVVSDSQTGEVRQCGDLSGYCITLNPWTQTLDATRAAPVTLEPLRDEAGRVITRAAPKGEATATANTAETPSR